MRYSRSHPDPHLEARLQAAYVKEYKQFYDEDEQTAANLTLSAIPTSASPTTPATVEPTAQSAAPRKRDKEPEDDALEDDGNESDDVDGPDSIPATPLDTKYRSKGLSRPKFLSESSPTVPSRRPQEVMRCTPGPTNRADSPRHGFENRQRNQGRNETDDQQQTNYRKERDSLHPIDIKYRDLTEFAESIPDDVTGVRETFFELLEKEARNRVDQERKAYKRAKNEYRMRKQAYAEARSKHAAILQVIDSKVIERRNRTEPH